MSTQLRWIIFMLMCLALTGRLVLADVPGGLDDAPDFHDGPQRGGCWHQAVNMPADSLHDGGLDMGDLQHVNTMIAATTSASKPADELAQEKYDKKVEAILAHLDSAKDRWLKKIERKSCPRTQRDGDQDSDDDRPSGGGGPGGKSGGKMAAGSMNDADSIVKQITQDMGLSSGGGAEGDMPKKGKKPTVKKDDDKGGVGPSKENALALDPDILKRTDEIADEIQDALDDREDECEAKMKKEMKSQQSGQMTAQRGQMQQQQMGQMGMGGNTNLMQMMMMGQATQMGQGGYQNPQAQQAMMIAQMSGQMGGVPANNAALQSAYLNPYGTSYNTNQSYSQYYFNPYLQRYTGY